MDMIEQTPANAPDGDAGKPRYMTPKLTRLPVEETEGGPVSGVSDNATFHS